MSGMYETPELLSEYLLFHYGKDEEILTPDREWPPGMREALGFPRRTVSHFPEGEAESGLDLGCAVGRSSYEMSRTCRDVIGVDFSHAFIGAAERLRNGERVSYHRLEEAAVRTRLEAKLPDGVDPCRVRFLRGDAMDLPEGIGVFDRVHAANLLCRLSGPMRLLTRLPGLVKPGGTLVLATPCTWLEAFTPPANWPKSGTLPWLEEHLGTTFDLIHQAEEPFLIRETARKFQWSSSLMTMWRRR